jgi:hypothetical protein
MSVFWPHVVNGHWNVAISPFVLRRTPGGDACLALSTSRFCAVRGAIGAPAVGSLVHWYGGDALGSSVCRECLGIWRRFADNCLHCRTSAVAGIGAKSRMVNLVENVSLIDAAEQGGQPERRNGRILKSEVFWPPPGYLGRSAAETQIHNCARRIWK